MMSRSNLRRAVVAIGLIALCADAPAFAADVGASVMPWWGWPLALFLLCFVLGIVAVPAGVGRGVLFVLIVAGFFPFHLDFVRGGGLLVALASALAASPGLLRVGLANLRLALPLSLLMAASQIAGAMPCRRIGAFRPRNSSRRRIFRRAGGG